jgi:hypothetical protein
MLQSTAAARLANQRCCCCCCCCCCFCCYIANTSAGLIQVDAAIENPTRTEPTHLLLRSNQPSQTVTLSLTNAGVTYPITYKLGHQPAAAVSLKDTWFVSNPEQLLQPLGASVSFAVAGKAVSEVVVQPGSTVDVQVSMFFSLCAAAAAAAAADDDAVFVSCGNAREQG